MAKPTFIASYTSVYTNDISPKTVSVTTQAGDTLVVYGGIENGNNSLNTPSGNGVSFTLNQSINIDGLWATANVWSGIDATGGTSWTLTCSRTAIVTTWGFTCLVFRNSDGIGASSQANVSGAAPSLNLTTTQVNSAIVVFNADWNEIDGTTRTWLTVNAVTPSIGNGLETTYARVPGLYTVYGAYYNDVGSVGSKTVGLSAPGGQKYSIVALEVKGSAVSVNTAMTAWWTA